jgi:hypothetical protein
MAPEAPTQLNAKDFFDVQALQSRWTESRRRAVNLCLDLYEKSVGQLADAHVKTARAVDLPGVVTLAETQAEMSRNVCDAYVSSARKLLDQ